MASFSVLLALLCLNVQLISSKSVDGVFSSRQARDTMGQYVSAFCFYGEGGVIDYTLNGTGRNEPTLLMYLDIDWQQILSDPDIACEKKLSMASITHTITNRTAKQPVPAVLHPQVWHVVYADKLSCAAEENENEKEADAEAEAEKEKEKEVEDVLDNGNYISYELQMLNPDVLGNPTVHFSDEDIGLYRFYQLLTLAFFVLGCIFGPQMYETLHTEGPMTLTIQLLSGTLVLQGSCSFLIMMHLRSYSKDGYGAPIFVLFAELLDLVSQSLILYMMLSLSLGRTFAGVNKPIKSFSKLQQQHASRIVTALAIVQAILLAWERYEERAHRMTLAPHRSMAGVSLAASRVILAAVVAGYQHKHITAERSAIKREFYATFTKYCLLWFLCFPALVLVSWMFSPYHRYKIVSMGVVVCQSVAAVLLYRLFLTRSLYWEVSSLGGSLLPLRMDKTLTMKLYS